VRPSSSIRLRHSARPAGPGDRRGCRPDQRVGQQYHAAVPPGGRPGTGRAARPGVAMAVNRWASGSPRSSSWPTPPVETRPDGSPPDPRPASVAPPGGPAQPPCVC